MIVHSSITGLRLFAEEPPALPQVYAYALFIKRHSSTELCENEP